MKFACPRCQQHIECETAYGGTEIQCPACTASMLVPLLTEEATTATSGTPALNIDYSRPELHGFDDFYQREIEPQMTSRLAHQSTARIKALASGLVGSILTALVGWWVGSKYGFDNPYCFIPVTLLAIVTGAAVWWPLDDLQKAVKGFLLLEVCRFFGFEYSENVGDAEFHEFEDSGLLPPYDRRDLEDRFSGNPNGVGFDMFECTLEQEKTSTDNDGRRTTTYKTIYHGVLFRFAFPKQFKGRTLVLKDAGLVGNLFKNLKASGQRITLEDPRFEKLFEVWGSDQIEARYLLTPTFMERMVELASAIDSKRIEFCFMNNMLLVSAHVKKDQFEGGGLFTSVVDKRRVERLVNEICRVFDIVDTLQLTLKTRI